MGFVAVAAWLAALGATGPVTLETGARVAGGTRRTLYASAPATTLGDAELAPRLALHREGRLRLSLSYEPIVRVPLEVPGHTGPDEAVEERRTTVVHDAQLSARRRMGTGTWTLAGTARGSHGEVHLLGREEGAAQPVATAARIPYVYARAGGAIVGEPTRRTSYAVDVGAFVTGGADAAAREKLPLQRAVALDAALRWRATPRDVVSSVLGLTTSRVDPNGESGYVLAGGGWRRVLRPAVAIQGSGGVAAAWAWDSGDVAVIPWAEAVLSRKPPEDVRPTAELRLALEPGIDRLTGRIDGKATADGWVRWRPSRTWRLQARSSVAALGAWRGAETIARAPEVLVGTAELRAIRGLRDRTEASFGVRAGAQSSDRAEAPTFREVGAFLEFTWGTSRRIWNG